jgi:hypothetical protein
MQGITESNIFSGFEITSDKGGALVARFKYAGTEKTKDLKEPRLEERVRQLAQSGLENGMSVAALGALRARMA